MRPTGSNADEWVLFLEEHKDNVCFCAVQIAIAIEAAETVACERALERMGWQEIRAFKEELARGQSIYEDAGGFMLRAIRRLFGLKPIDELVGYRNAALALIATQPAPATEPPK